MMKNLKHLRKLALLSSLALSFGVQADGTLPLPLQVERYPLAMDGNVDGVATLNLKIGSLDNVPAVEPKIPTVAKLCGGTDLFYSASGSLVLNSGKPSAERLKVYGVCAPSDSAADATVTRRVVIATDDSAATPQAANKLVKLDGIVAADATKTLSGFSGTFNTQALGLRGGLTGGTPATAAPISFVFSAISAPGIAPPGVVVEPLPTPTSTPSPTPTFAPAPKFQLIRK